MDKTEKTGINVEAEAEAEAGAGAGAGAGATGIQTSDDHACKVNCTNIQSVNSIRDVALAQFSEFANTCGVKDPSELISLFNKTFTTALSENITINGLPVKLSENKELTLFEEKEHKDAIDEEMFSKLSKTISTVAHQRKFAPEHCCRILKMQTKHDFEKLKKAKVITSPAPSASITVDANECRENVEKFSNFCKKFNALKEAVQCRLKEKEELENEIKIAKDIRENQSTSMDINEEQTSVEEDAIRK